MTHQSQKLELLGRTSNDILQAIRTNQDYFTSSIKSQNEATSSRNEKSDELVSQTGEDILAALERLAQSWETANMTAQEKEKQLRS
jgi:hypothetical protein